MSFIVSHSLCHAYLLRNLEAMFIRPLAPPPEASIWLLKYIFMAISPALFRTFSLLAPSAS